MGLIVMKLFRRNRAAPTRYLGEERRLVTAPANDAIARGALFVTGIFGFVAAGAIGIAFQRGNSLPVLPVPFAVYQKDEITTIMEPYSGFRLAEPDLAKSMTASYVRCRVELVENIQTMNDTWGPGGCVESMSSPEEIRRFQSETRGLRDAAVAAKQWRRIDNLNFGRQLGDGRSGQVRGSYATITFDGRQSPPRPISRDITEFTLDYEWRAKELKGDVGAVPNPTGFTVTNFPRYQKVGS